MKGDSPAQRDGSALASLAASRRAGSHLAGAWPEWGAPRSAGSTEVSSNDQASFLPAGAEATAAQDWQAKFRDSADLPAVIVIENGAAFSPAELGELPSLKDGLEGLQPGGAVIGPFPSEDGKAVQFMAPMVRRGSEGRRPGVAGLTDTSAPQACRPSSPAAGLTADLVSAFAGIDGILLLVALGAVFLILLVVYRSLLCPSRPAAPLSSRCAPRSCWCSAWPSWLDPAERPKPGHPVHPGDRRGHGLRTAVRGPLPGGADPYAPTGPTR